MLNWITGVYCFVAVLCEAAWRVVKKVAKAGAGTHVR